MVVSRWTQLSDSPYEVRMAGLLNSDTEQSASIPESAEICLIRLRVSVQVCLTNCLRL